MNKILHRFGDKRYGLKEKLRIYMLVEDLNFSLNNEIVGMATKLRHAGTGTVMVLDIKDIDR